MMAPAGAGLTQEIFVHPQALVESTDIGANTRIWAFAHVLAGARIGAECNIGDHAYIEGDVVLGNNVTVKNGVAIWNKVIVEDSAFLGPNCVFTNDRNPRSYIKKQVEQLEQTLIRSNATIGANATILCGLTIGTYAFIGAGSVVIRSVPDYAIVVGNPARQTGWMCRCAQKLSLLAGAALHSRVTCLHCRRGFIRTQTGMAALKEMSAKEE